MDISIIDNVLFLILLMSYVAKIGLIISPIKHSQVKSLRETVRSLLKGICLFSIGLSIIGLFISMVSPEFKLLTQVDGLSVGTYMIFLIFSLSILIFSSRIYKPLSC